MEFFRRFHVYSTPLATQYSDFKMICRIFLVVNSIHENPKINNFHKNQISLFVFVYSLLFHTIIVPLPSTVLIKIDGWNVSLYQAICRLSKWSGLRPLLLVYSLRQNTCERYVWQRTFWFPAPVDHVADKYSPIYDSSPIEFDVQKKMRRALTLAKNRKYSLNHREIIILFLTLVDNFPRVWTRDRYIV